MIATPATASVEPPSQVSTAPPNAPRYREPLPLMVLRHPLRPFVWGLVIMVEHAPFPLGVDATGMGVVI